MSARFVRVAETGRQSFTTTFDEATVRASEGDTLMCRTPTAQDALHDREFGDGRRAAFYLMACAKVAGYERERDRDWPTAFDEGRRDGGQIYRPQPGKGLRAL
ncbi:hypothetical protein [Caballeronia arvi]|uniref:hypothetical protein n=1 Tax=Caballeronia arvi TaxID=1777135 RepID=UPI00190E666F